MTLTSLSKALDCNGKTLDLSRPQVMGVLNVTPDSFSDGGNFISVDKTVEQAQRMAEGGGAIIDTGGKSTRPGAEPVPVEAELRRVLPVIEALQTTISTVWSAGATRYWSACHASHSSVRYWTFRSISVYIPGLRWPFSQSGRGLP